MTTESELKQAFILAAKAKKALDKRQKARKWLNSFMGNHAGNILTDDTDELQVNLNKTINKSLDDIHAYMSMHKPTEEVLFDVVKIGFHDFKSVLTLLEEREAACV